jgi:hypothetical protein
MDMRSTENLKILSRLLEIAKNPLEYSLYPKPFKEEHIFLANHLNEARQRLEVEFNNAFKKAVGAYKSTLKEHGFGYFHSPETLVYIRMQINQISYVVYGDYVHEIKFNEDLGKAAYKDLIEQIDRTVLMTPAQLKKHTAECNRISKEIIDEILKEEREK